MISLKIGLIVYPLGGYFFAQAVNYGGTPACWILLPISCLLLMIGAYFVLTGIEEITMRKR